MDPNELIRKIGQNVPHQPETDWAGREIPDRIQIENAIIRSRNQSQVTNRELRRLERRLGRGPERG